MGFDVPSTRRGSEASPIGKISCQYVQKGPDNIRWVFDRNEFDELIAVKKESALGPDGTFLQLLQMCGRVGFANSV